MNHLRLFIMSLARTGFIACAEAPDPQQSLDGSWRPLVYQLHQGERESVDGILFLNDGVWSVVFFVLDESGEPVRGSGEGGSSHISGFILNYSASLNYPYISVILTLKILQATF